MDTTARINPTTTDRLLACFGLAVDEAKLIRSIEFSKKHIASLESENPSSERLIFLKREMANLEKRLALIRAEADKSRASARLAVQKQQA